MEPNNNQPINTNPLQQPVVPQPITTPTDTVLVVPPPTPPAEPTQTTDNQNTQSPKNNKKILILIAVLILLLVGMVTYVMFAKNQLSNKQKTDTSNQSVVLPTATIAPTKTPENDLDIASPEADLQDIEKDVQGL